MTADILKTLSSRNRWSEPGHDVEIQVYDQEVRHGQAVGRAPSEEAVIAMAGRRLGNENPTVEACGVPGMRSLWCSRNENLTVEACDVPGMRT
ncbi:hypothetical protein J6590_075073 [Homalodisca vitripennis]|nr:hypothetical protein J6590_075073 [Homalodisca vitripennis]